jgi:DNA polymerase III delta prime subunit
MKRTCTLENIEIQNAVKVEEITPKTFIMKYKPYYISDFHIDEDVVKVIQTLFEMDDLNIMFVSTANSGKTTFLNAIIREYYELRRNDPIPEHNILFVNNLKEQGINYYRTEMKTFCQTHSSIYGKKKIIFIDDIDTINEQSQQVFRNYIDKYKHNVHFISVCVNIQKIIESFQSRVHILNLPHPTVRDFENIMEKIITEERIVIDDAAKQYLLDTTNNSIRNLINNLEKIYIYREPVDLELCKKLCSNVYFLHFEDYFRNVRSGKLMDAVQILFSIHEYGYSVIDILDYLFMFIKTTQVLEEEEKYKLIPYLCKYIIVFHNIHENSIELALFTNNIMRILSETE